MDGGRRPGGRYPVTGSSPPRFSAGSIRTSNTYLARRRKLRARHKSQVAACKRVTDLSISGTFQRTPEAFDKLSGEG
jgi:hypothetical protein